MNHPQNVEIAKRLWRTPNGERLSHSVLAHPNEIRCGADAMKLCGATTSLALVVQESIDQMRHTPIRALHEKPPFAHRVPQDTPPGPKAHSVTKWPPQPDADKHRRPKKRGRVEIRRYVNTTSQTSHAAFLTAETSPDFTIIVDHRERTSKSHSSFSQWMRATGDVACSDAQLPSGDFMFSHTASGNLYPAIVERKTLVDLAGSIITPRLSQQKRLLHAAEMPLAILLLEGNLRPGSPDTANLSPDDLKRLHSSLATTAAVDGFSVFHCRTRRETLGMLKAIGSFLAQRFKRLPPFTQVNPITPIAAMKDIIDRKSIFPGMLANIRGCAPDAACAIALEFKSPTNLQESIEIASKVPAKELEFVHRIQSHKRRQKEGAELSLLLMQLFGSEVNDP